ncbi:MAG: PH domain-containing protein [Dehalogenimonas sp.]
MMRYPSGKSTGFGVLIWGVVITLAVSAFIVPAGMRVVVTAGSIIGIGFILWIWYGTYYEFHDICLLTKMGPFAERIPYERITSVKPVTGMASSMALSSAMIEIRHGKNYVSGTTFISPENRELFLAELRARCPNLRLSNLPPRTDFACRAPVGYCKMTVFRQIIEGLNAEQIHLSRLTFIDRRPDTGLKRLHSGNSIPGCADRCLSDLRQ